MSWFESWFELLLTLSVITSTAFTLFILTLPSRSSNVDVKETTGAPFTDDDRKHAERSGYAYFNNHKDDDGKFRFTTTVQVVVLGDIGRSPRMQYHALSIANHGGRVDLVGFVESEVHPDVQAHRFINVTTLKPFPRILQTSNRLLFLLFAPLKVLWQIWILYQALGYRTEASKWMMVQNPPSIPTLAVAQFVCFFRNTRLVIDWHNFGYTILALKLGAEHPFVRISQWYEGFFAQYASAHFAVTNAMTKLLRSKWKVNAFTLHDRPPRQFQPMAKEQRLSFLRRLPETSSHAGDIEKGRTRLVVSSTSWTADEDFSILLDALVDYSKAVERTDGLPKLLVVITGKGPLKDYYLTRIKELYKLDKLAHVTISTAWLSTEDYASLLGSADIGVSLHTSSSGVDLPMKAVDMLGTGLPVLGWSMFEAWSELIREDDNGCGFGSAEELAMLLQTLFGENGKRLERLRQGALKECDRRWDDEWLPVAGKLFHLEG